jgi:hypothetical protein
MNYRLSLYVRVALVFLLCTNKALAASYFGISGGAITYEVTNYDENMIALQEEVNGSSFGVAIGHFLTNSLAVELGHLSANFEKTNVEVTSPAAFGIETNSEISIISYGVRWFIFDYLNFKFGGTRSEFNPKIKTTGALASVDNEVDTRNGTYYGVGTGYTMQKLQLFYDYTIFPNEDGTNPVATNLGIRLFF